MTVHSVIGYEIINNKQKLVFSLPPRSDELAAASTGLARSCADKIIFTYICPNREGVLLENGIGFVDTSTISSQKGLFTQAMPSAIFDEL